MERKYTTAAAERKIAKFIVNRRITSKTRLTAALSVFWALSLLTNIVMLCVSLFYGSSEDRAPEYDPSASYGVKTVFADITGVPRRLDSSEAWLLWYSAGTDGREILLRMTSENGAELEQRIGAEGVVRIYGTSYPLPVSDTDALSLSLGMSPERFVGIYGSRALIYMPDSRQGSSSSQPVSMLSALLLSGLIFFPAVRRQFSLSKRCRGTLRNSLDTLRARDAPAQAAAELDSGGNTVFGEGYRSGKYRTVLTAHYIFGSRMYSAADYGDLLWYYYQPGKLRHNKSAGYIIAYGRDKLHSYCFFLGTEEPEAAAKRAIEIIQNRNPSAVYGAENKDRYLALLDETE